MGMRIALHEMETRMFWRLSTDLHQALRADDMREAEDLLNEIGGMLICTTDPEIRRRCSALLEQAPAHRRVAATR